MTGKTRILVVDDDVAVRRLIRANLEARGYEISQAVNGTEALEVLESNVPDLLILDIKMPGLDGVEVCRRIREWSMCPY